MPLGDTLRTTTCTMNDVADLIQTGSLINVGTSSGSANAQTASSAPTFTGALYDGLVVHGFWGFTNTSAALTFTINGIGPKAVKLRDGSSDPGIASAFLGEPFVLKYSTTASSGSGGWLIISYAPPTLLGAWGITLTTVAQTNAQMLLYGATLGAPIGMIIPQAYKATHISAHIGNGASFSGAISMILFKSNITTGAGGTATLPATTDRNYSVLAAPQAYAANDILDVRITHAGGTTSAVLFVSVWGK